MSDEVIVYVNLTSNEVIKHSVGDKNPNTLFYDIQEVAIAFQRMFKNNELNEIFIIKDDVVYEINPSVKHRKVTGDIAKKVKRFVANYKQK